MGMIVTSDISMSMQRHINSEYAKFFQLCEFLKREQRGLSYSQNKPLSQNSNYILSKDTHFEDCSEEKIFSEEELENISGLCDVLQNIRKRLISEGFSMDELREKFNRENGILNS